MNQLKIVFMGTATFSEAVLKNLIQHDYNIVQVVSQPDRRVGRKKELKMPEVKVVALEHDIPVFQPQRIKDDYQAIIDMQPDLIITAAYGQMIPQKVLDCPRLGCINVHASLLPKYRGGAPVHYAILNGDEKTGVTIMYMVKKMDAGNIIYQKETPISNDETVGELYDRLSILGAEAIIEAMPAIIEGTNESIPQDESKVTYSPVISREQEKIDFNKPAVEVYNHVRGLNPWPGAYTTYQGKTVKIYQGLVHNCPNAMTHHAHQEPGTIVKIFKDAILINVGRGSAISNKDLIEVLNQGHLYGVGLDVVEEEPLPSTSPLWTYERVLITPHSSGGFVWQSVRNYYTELVIRNIEHLKNHETLENEVDFQTGYRKVVTYKK